MSFNNYQSTNNTLAMSTSGDGQDFTKLAQTIANNVQKISNNVYQMERMVNQLGTNQESENLRSQLHDLQHYTNQVAKDTNKCLKELGSIPPSIIPSEQKQRKMQKERLTNDFSEALKNFQVIQRTEAQKEKEELIRVRANSQSNQDTSRSNLIDFQSNTGQVLLPPPPGSRDSAHHQQQQMQAILQDEENIASLKEREQAIRKIESDIVEVNQIFKEIATIVHDQGEVIDSIEANIETTHIQIHEGTENIVKASDYARRARKKKIVIILILLLILTFIGLIIYISGSH